jgi:hypothetical protein
VTKVKAKNIYWAGPEQQILATTEDTNMARFRGAGLAIVIVIAVFAVGVWAVTCVNPDSAGAGSAWPKGATINVNLSNFPAALQPCVKSAFDNWSTNNPSNNGSGVTYNPTFDGPTLATGTTGGTNVYQVTYGPTYDGNGNSVNALGSTHDTSSGGSLKNAKTEINSNITDCTAITQTMAHEIGHTMGLGECSQCTLPQQSVMIGGKCAIFSGNICIAPVWNDSTYGLPGPTSCDNTIVKNVYFPPPPIHCAAGCYIQFGRCVCPPSPIILDLNGQGFDLTSAAGGVFFDMAGTGNPVQMGWIAEGADNAFLALPGPDGLIHNGTQLFGNFTPQPQSDHPNGFAALAVYDLPANGGNGDGIIDNRDAIWLKLRLWIDTNHDGISQPEELHTLPSLGVNSISLTYKLSEKEDQYGNRFRYRAKVNPDDPDARVDRTAYDVFFVILDSSGTAKNLLNPDGSKCAVPVQTKGGMLSTTGTLR